MTEYRLSAAEDGFRPLLTRGQFFPEETEEMEQLFKDTEKNSGAALIAKEQQNKLLRGAFKYSGPTNIAVLKNASAMFGTVPCIIMLAQSLRDEEENIWLPDYRGFNTPFRRFTINTEIVNRMTEASTLFLPDRVRFEEDPAFDIPLTILGFLGYYGDVLPIITGSSSTELMKVIMKTITTVFSTPKPLLFYITGLDE